MISVVKSLIFIVKLIIIMNTQLSHILEPLAEIASRDQVKCQIEVAMYKDHYFVYEKTK